MMSIIRTLLRLLASVALMVAASGKLGVGGLSAGPGLGVTHFVGAHCTATGKLSSGLFLNGASVLRHIAAVKPCHA